VISRVDACLGKYDDKFISAVSRDDIDIPQAFDQNLSKLDENLTAGLMAMSVVDFFEMIDVKENQADFGFIALAPSQLNIQRLFQVAVIKKFCQIVGYHQV
jgi:hypothetical protein